MDGFFLFIYLHYKSGFVFIKLPCKRYTFAGFFYLKILFYICSGIKIQGLMYK